MEKADRETIYLVDGSNYLFRAFYAIRELSNSRGFPTNAVFGFTGMILKLLRERDPRYLAVVFDVKGPTFRHEAYADYKATRAPIPETLVPQIPVVKDVVRAFGIPIIERPGLEADDVIGTLAVTWAARGKRVVIVSGDKDLLQLVSPLVTVLDTMKDVTYDEQAVRARFGVDPPRVADLLALMGDASDNVPGVPGIGAKGAQGLIQEFGSLENLLEKVEKVKNRRAKEALRNHAPQARMSLELVRIRTDADVPMDLEALTRRERDAEALVTIFRDLEFSSFLQELRGGGTEEALPFREVKGPEDLETLLAAVRRSGTVALEPVLSGPEAMRARLEGLAFAVPDQGTWFLPLPGPEGGVPTALAEALGDGRIVKWGHDLKTAHITLRREGIQLKAADFDTMIAAYCLNPSRRGFDLPDLALDYLKRSAPGLGRGGEEPRRRACRRAASVLELKGVLEGLLVRDGLDELYRRVEMPLITVLAGMEMRGVLLDLGLLKDLSRELQNLIEISLEKIYRLAGERFNVNSPKQLQTILFDKLKMPRGRKIKEGYSTDGEVLANLAKDYELPAEILAYRGIMKLKTTYVDALPLLVNERTGRVHTSYNQAVTATGRLSSSNPNLQNIPVRTLEGKRIRQAFIAPPGWGLLSADYSQIELRVLAHLSGDETLLAAFAADEDIHTSTASTLFGVFPQMVNETMRRQAKVINFGIIYGMSAFGLAKELGIPQKLAQSYIDEYFRKYGGVRRYLERTLDEARRVGYVQTLLNRRRYLPELGAENAAVRQFAERTAVNTPIQGSAADLIKMAMIRIAGRMEREGLKAEMIMQVHDELVFEAPGEERDRLMTLVREEMEGVAALKVPLKVDMGFGANWDEAHR